MPLNFFGTDDAVHDGVDGEARYALLMQFLGDILAVGDDGGGRDAQRIGYFLVEQAHDDAAQYLRQLGIPTVVDRMFQQAIAQVLSPIYERQFSDGSYGFRPRRGGKKALIAATKIVEQGYRYAVDIDLERFFDTVNHAKLIEILQRIIKDDAVISLIHRYLNAGVMKAGDKHL